MKRFGLTKEEAEAKVKDAYQRRGRSTSIKKKESPASHFNTIEYWACKGYSSEEALIKKAEHIENMQAAFHKELKNNPEKYKGRTPLQLDYWTDRGYSSEEAKDLRKERQKTFTLEKCILRYGEEIGFELWRERNVKWSKKVEQKYKNGEFTKFCKHNYSNTELKFFEHLLSVYTPKSNYHCALPGNRQFFRYFKEEGVTLAYDFVCGKKMIEFNGDYWHCNPLIYSADYFHKYMKCTAQQKWDADKYKINLIQKLGYEVLIVWESEYKKDPDQIITKCIKFLNS